MAAIIAVRSLERCDTCGADAYWRYDHGKARLCFCGHHSTEKMKALQAAGFVPSILVVKFEEKP